MLAVQSVMELVTMLDLTTARSMTLEFPFFAQVAFPLVDVLVSCHLNTVANKEDSCRQHNVPIQIQNQPHLKIHNRVSNPPPNHPIHHRHHRHPTAPFPLKQRASNHWVRSWPDAPNRWASFRNVAKHPMTTLSLDVQRDIIAAEIFLHRPLLNATILGNRNVVMEEDRPLQIQHR